MHSWWHSLVVSDGHGRPRQAGDLLTLLRQSPLVGASLTSKAREGSRAGVGSHPTATAIEQGKLCPSRRSRLGCCTQGLSRETLRVSTLAHETIGTVKTQQPSPCDGNC